MPAHLSVERHWACPNCSSEHVTNLPGQVSPFHPCPGLRGLTAPYVPAGVKAKVEAVERGDYTGGDLVTIDAVGRAVMAILTTRDDGTDCAALAPTAQIRRRGA